MKILFLFTVNKSFLSDYFVSLAKHVSALGHEIIVFSFKQGEDFKKLDGVTFITKKRKGTLQQYRTIYRLIKTEKPAIVVSNFSYVNPALLFGKWLKIKENIAWQHTLIQQTKASKRQIFIKSKFLNRADGIVVNSNRLKSELENEFGLQNKRIEILPFWSSIDRYTPKSINLPETDFIIGCCGRLEIDKNQRILLQAFAELRKLMPNTKLTLVLAGEGSDRLYLEKMTKELGVTNSVVFLGLLSAQEMAYFYTEIDLLVLPSLHEAFGLTFIEALSLNRPVLVSQAFGALSFVEPSLLEKYNMVFKPDDATMLSTMLENYVELESYRRQDFRALYDVCFSSEIILKKFEKIIDLNQPEGNAI